MSSVLLTIGRVHIIGIGGAGMSALARILVAQGVQVSGSDVVDSERLDALRELGIAITVGHPPFTAIEPHLVVRSSAIADDDPTVLAARAAGIAIWSRADALSDLMAQMTVAAVAGTHGKTTTSSMLTLMLRAADIDCTYVIGSELAATGVNAALGTSQIAVVEADESDGTFLRLQPTCAVVTNIDCDHMDRWQSQEALETAFFDFVAGVGRSVDLVALCVDDAGARRLAQRLAENASSPHVMTYGFDSMADVHIEMLHESAMGVAFATSGALVLETAVTHVPGRHNVLNAVAAAIVARHLGVESQTIVNGLAEYQGARRRFELRGAQAGVRVFDDYAHHPTAVAATLSAAQPVAKPGRVVALCQPYRWYRTAMFTHEYAEALAHADHTVLVDVYGPGEQPIAHKGSRQIAQLLSEAGGSVHFAESVAAAIEYLASTCAAGDVVLTLGGEDIRPAGPLLLAALAERARHGSNGAQDG